MMKWSSIRRAAYGLMTLLATLVLGLGVVKALQSPFFSVKKIDVFLDAALKGASPLNEETVRELASIPSSQNIFSLDLESVAFRIKGHEWVQDVQVGTRLPDRIEIRVEMRRPLAISQNEKGRLRYVDRFGNSFGDFDSQQSSDLPMLTKIPEEKIPEAVSFLKKWESHSIRSWAELSGMGYSDQQGFQAYVVLKNLQRSALLLGDSEKSDLDQIEKVMRYVNKNNILTRQIRADVSKKIVVKITRGS